MPTATLEKPKQMVSAPPREIVYMARREDLKLVISRKWDRKDGEGNVVETIPGKHVKFTKGVLRVPPKGRMRGEYGEDLDAAEVIAHLEGGDDRLPHEFFGDRQEGFWRLEQPAPPATQEEHDRLTELSMDLDVAGLQEFVRQESAGWARPELLELAGRSLERAESRLAERDAELAKARAEGAAEASKASKPAPGTVKAS